MPGALDSLSTLTPLPVSTLPQEVREGSDRDRRVYRAALGFERQLLAELTRSAKPQDGDEGSADAGVQSYEQMLPDALADSAIASGGTGLAEDLYRALRQGEAR